MIDSKVAEVVRTINQYLSSHLWFDFEFVEYQPYRLTIVGGIDLTVPPEVEIWFEDVVFISGPPEWGTDTSSPALSVHSGLVALNQHETVHVEQGFYLFRFAPKFPAASNGFVVTAREIGFRLVTEQSRWAILQQ